MTGDKQEIIQRTGTDVLELAAPMPQQPPKQENPLLVLHNLLRGRYWLAILLATIGGAIGGALGYYLPPVEYRSVGMVRIHPILPRILWQTEQNSIMPMFESFVQTQVALLTDPRVRGLAMGRPEWKSLGRLSLPKQIEEFEKSLSVSTPRGSPIIYVSFVDRDPRAAAAGAKAVISAFKEISDQEQSDEAKAKLDRYSRDLEDELRRKNQLIASKASEYGSNSLQQLYDYKLSELYKIESQLRAVQVQKLLAGGSHTTSPATAADSPTTQPLEAALELLAARDQQMLELQRQRGATDREIRTLAGTLGHSHPKVVDAKVSLNVLDEDIQRRYEQLRKQLEVAGGSAAAVVEPDGVRQMSLEQLAASEKALQQLHDHLNSEVAKIGQQNVEMEGYRTEAQQVRERLTEAKTRLEQLNLEGSVGGRISIQSYGNLPLWPDNDRRAKLAPVGALGMAGLGVGVVVLMGLLDRRMRHIDTARSRLRQIDRLLGVLPELPSDLSDPEQAASAAYCVHQIRAMLQIRQRASGRKVFAITSPSPGDGKTSLAITLGMSLASSGYNTLLIDCDMEGGGLSSRMGRAARRPLGQVLLDQNLLGEAKLEEAQRLAREKGMRLGEALIELGYLSASQLSAALREQGELLPGLGDVLGGEAPEKAIVATGHSMLSVLPLGMPPRTHAGRLSPEALRRVLDSVSATYDIVLIDCGPVLGSVEAAIVSAEADSVILVVSRNGDRRAAENAANFLITAGAEVEGIVFNRALSADIASSSLHSSSSARSVRAGIVTGAGPMGSVGEVLHGQRSSKAAAATSQAEGANNS